jgi:hypothetical protein
MSRRTMFALAVLALPLFVWGCSKPPEVEIQKAQAAMAAARTAEAQQYAPKALSSAQDTLNAAMAYKQEQDAKFVLFRRYEKGRQQLIKAETMAQKAEADAKAEKERVRQEVMGMLSSATTEFDAVKVAFQTAPKGKGNKAELALIEAEIQSVEGPFAEAKAEFDGGRFLTAKPKVTAVREQIRRINDEIAQAAAMATAKKPAK